jgi:hypothetical protein
MICASTALVLQLWSFHTVKVPNSQTFGAGIECDRQVLTYQAGAFRNSFNHVSAYAVVGKQWPVGGFQVGPFAGVLTGYKTHEAPVWHGLTPLVGLEASHALGWGFKGGIQVAPAGNGAALVHFTLSRAL